MNDPAKIEFRAGIRMIESVLAARAKTAGIDVSPEKYPLRHYFTPIEERFGCCMYARGIFIPKGEFIIGKIHKYPHLNFLMKGKISVATENGRDVYEAPMVIVSQTIGIKKAGYALEDTLWVTVHFSENGDESVEHVESEVTVQRYSDLGMIDSIEQPLEIEI